MKLLKEAMEHFKHDVEMNPGLDSLDSCVKCAECLLELARNSKNLDEVF